MDNMRIDCIERYESACDSIRKKYPCIDFDTFAEDYYKKFDETETGTYSELTKKRDKLIDSIKPMFDSYNHERERQLNNAKVWLKRMMFEDCVDKFSNDIIVQNKISEYLYSKANAESETLAECWNNLDKYNIIVSDILSIIKDGDKGV